MKLKIQYIIAIISIIFASCEYDNYDEPDTFLKGRIVYQGEPINVSYNDVYFQLIEPGWQLTYPINVAVDQDGSFSALLFKADYKLVLPEGQGPYKSLLESNSDSLDINLNGSTEMDIEVLPYYMVKNTGFSVSGTTVTSTFGLDQIITGDDAKDVERVNLYISKTAFVDTRTSVSTSEMGGGDIADLNSISLSTDIPDLVPTQNYVFARVGVKIAGVEDMLFSDIQKVEF